MPLHRSLIVIVAVLLATRFAAAQGLSSETPDTNGEARIDARDAPAASVFSSDDAWARKLVEVIVFGFFLPAVILGPWIRRRAATALPELHAQEEQSAMTASQHEPGHGRTR